MYIHLDTEALDALDPAEAYAAAVQAPQDAKAIASAYADAVAYRLAVRHGQISAASILGISQPTLSDRYRRHDRQLRRRVDEGAHYLDMTYPGWPDRADPDILDMSSATRDILDMAAIHPFEPGVEPTPAFFTFIETHGRERAVEHAFEVGPGETYDDLTRLWADLLRARQGQLHERRKG